MSYHFKTDLCPSKYRKIPIEIISILLIKEKKRKKWNGIKPPISWNSRYKPSLNKILFECNRCVLQHQFFFIFPLTSSKFFSFLNSHPICSSSYSLNKYVRLCLLFQMFVSLKMAPVSSENTYEKYSAFWYSFDPEIRWLIRSLERITNRISRSEASVLFSQALT